MPDEEVSRRRFLKILGAEAVGAVALGVFLKNRPPNTTPPEQNEKLLPPERLEQLKKMPGGNRLIY